MRPARFSQLRSSMGSKHITWLFLGLVLGCVIARARVQHLYIVHTNDIQGALLPNKAFWMNRDFPPPLANAPGALTVIRELRAEAAQKGYGFLLLDAGDAFRGKTPGELSSSQAVVDYFNRAGYDAIELGQYDCLSDTNSGMPWICSNLQIAGRNIRPNRLFEQRGIKIGIFGLITKYAKSAIKDKDYDAVASDQIAKLRRQGADIIVGLTSIGYRNDKRLADDVVGIDIIIGGYSRTGVEPPYESPKNHTIVCQAYSRLSAIGFLDLAVDTDSRHIIGYEGHLINLYGEEIPKDPAYMRYLDSLKAKKEKGFDKVIGKSVRELVRCEDRESPVGNLVTDAMREFTGADIALHNSDGITADIPCGEITYRDIYNLARFGNTVVTGEYAGRQVREMLEVSVSSNRILQVSGLKMGYAKKRPLGSRVLSVVVGGEALEPDRLYKVCTNSYLATGKSGFGVFQTGKHISDSGVLLRDVVADYIRRNSPVNARIQGRIVLQDSRP